MSSVRGGSNVTKVKVRWCYRPNGESCYVYSLAHSSFNQGSRVRFLAGSQRIVNLFGTGMPHEYYYTCGKVGLSGEGDIRSDRAQPGVSVTIYTKNPCYDLPSR